jgi:hypothetical protein
MKKFIITLTVLIATTINLNAQTTVITHGYAAALSDPINGWMLDMANGICARAGNGVVRMYNKTTGNFDYVSGSGTRTVLLFDWWDDSNDLHKGFSEGAGAALFAALMNGYKQNDFNLNELHFIGHSRGCIVNSEAIERLLVLGLPVEQATSLDAHDWGGGSIAITDYDANPDSINSGVEGWAGIGWADSYWQDALFSTNGRAVEGTYSVYKGTITHDGIHDWYLQTITDTTLHEGYYFSHLGGGSANRPTRTGIQRNPFFTFPADGILNGNFERGGVIYQTIAGWWYHGGGGDADIDNTYMVLHSGGFYKTHDRFYIPPGTSAIKFDCKIDANDDSGVIPNIDKMIVLINDSIVLDNIWMDTIMNDWSQLSINVSSLQNSVITLGFKLVDEFGGNSELNSEIWLDTIHFEMLTVPVESDYQNETGCILFPNPASDKVTIIVPQKSEIEILTIEGQIIKRLNSDENYITIDISDFAKGIYFVKLKTENGIGVNKFIKE